MNQLMLVIIVAAVAMGLLVIGMSLTLIFKGHHIQSEIGENPEMKKRGIKCTAQQMREEELGPGAGECATSCGEGDCGTCSKTLNHT